MAHSAINRLDMGIKDIRGHLSRRCLRPFATACPGVPATHRHLSSSGPHMLAGGLRPCVRKQQRAYISTAAAALADLPIAPIVSTQGFIQPQVPDGAQACVLAIYDSNQKLQYVGFSKDLRNSLRTLFSRRPDKAFYYRAEHLQAVDQAAMMAIRDAWFEQLGGAPIGNKLALERSAWQQPMEAFAISERGKQAAAEEAVKQQQQALKDRGCKEEFVPNPELLILGQVDFLASEAMSPQELAEQQRRLQEASRRKKTGVVAIDGEDEEFTVLFTGKHATKAGHMVDVQLTHANRESVHRIIIASCHYEPYGADVETAVMAVLGLLLSMKLPRQTEGLILSSIFPVNYFSITELQQWYPEEFAAAMAAALGQPLQPQEGQGAWRFNKLFDYRPMAQAEEAGAVI